MIWATNKSFVQWLPLTPYVLKQTNTSSNKNRNLLSFTNSTHMFGQHSETLVLFAVNSPCCPHVSMNVFQSSYPTAFILVVKASAACSKLKPIRESGSEDMLIACQCPWPWHQQTTRRQKLFLTQDLNEGGGQPKTKHELNIATGQSQFNDRVAPGGVIPCKAVGDWCWFGRLSNIDFRSLGAAAEEEEAGRGSSGSSNFLGRTGASAGRSGGNPEGGWTASASFPAWNSQGPCRSSSAGCSCSGAFSAWGTPWASALSNWVWGKPSSACDSCSHLAPKLNLLLTDFALAFALLFTFAFAFAFARLNFALLLAFLASVWLTQGLKVGQKEQLNSLLDFLVSSQKIQQETCIYQTEFSQSSSSASCCHLFHWRIFCDFSFFLTSFLRSMNSLRSEGSSISRSKFASSSHSPGSPVSSSSDFFCWLRDWQDDGLWLCFVMFFCLWSPLEERFQSTSKT